MSVNRRTFLSRSCGGATAFALAVGAGCTAAGFGGSDEAVRTYALTMTAPDPDADEASVLDYESEALAIGQRELVETAARTGVYAEKAVSWGTVPGREPITMEFQMLLQLIARHVDRDAELTVETSFETPSAYGGRRYRTIVDVE